jgi:hypothetical protein
MTMKKTSGAKPRKTAEAAKEYKLDYGKAKPNHFVASAKAMSFVAVIDSDVAKIFTTTEQVNTALRALILAMPQTIEKTKAISLRSEKIMEIRKKLGAGKQNKKSSIEILSEMRR